MALVEISRTVFVDPEEVVAVTQMGGYVHVYLKRHEEPIRVYEPISQVIQKLTRGL